VRRRNLKV